MRSRLGAGALLGAVLLLIGGTLVLSSGAARATAVVTTTRYGGSDRYATAAMIAEAAFPSGSSFAVLARGEDFPDGTPGFADALSGDYLAGALHAPVLLVTADTVPQETAAAIQKLKVKTVDLLGGPYAVSEVVSNALLDMGLTVTRIAGSDRYETAELVAARAGTSALHPIHGVATAIVARGDDFPDALAGGVLAYASGLPLVLTPPDALSPYAAETLANLNIKHALILGGTYAISSSTEASIDALGVTTQRLAGADRAATAAVIASYAVQVLSYKDTVVNLATGTSYPDALAGGSLAAVDGPSVMLLAASSSSLGNDTQAWISSYDGTISQINVLGLSYALNDSTVQTAQVAATCLSAGTHPSTTAPSPGGLLGLLGGGSSVPTTTPPPTTPCAPTPTAPPTTAGPSTTTTSTSTSTTSTTIAPTTTTA